MQTKVMRSASSEDMRSEARRAIRTREGKGRETNLFFSLGAESADLGELGAGGFVSLERHFGGQATETLVLP